jgi:uncharacterized membrane protein YvlD (DUF360 family)
MNLSSPVRILLKAVLNVALVWAMTEYLGDYFLLTGGITAWIIVGSLVTLLNILVRPILALLTLPLKLFATILALIIVNGAFVQLVHMIILEMRPDIVTLEISGGLWGWTVIACTLGIANWIMKEILR